MKKRMCGRDGFTISELLVCLLILIITASCTASILSTVIKSQQKTKFEIDRIKLTSALNISLTDTLTSACDIRYENNSLIFTSNIGKNVRFELTDGVVTVVHQDESVVPFISDSYYGSVDISKFEIEYDKTLHLFDIEYTVSESDVGDYICRKKIVCLTE